MSSPQTAAEILERTYLQIRARLLEVGAALDRLERADEWDDVSQDARLAKIREALAILPDSGFDRAERIQRVFSDEYDPNWREQSSV